MLCLIVKGDVERMISLEIKFSIGRVFHYDNRIGGHFFRFGRRGIFIFWKKPEPWLAGKTWYRHRDEEGHLEVNMGGLHVWFERLSDAALAGPTA